MNQIDFSHSTPQRISATRQSKPSLHALALGLALAGCSVQAYAATNYTLTDLTALSPSGAFYSTAFNSNGLILGNVEVITTPPGYGTLHTFVPHVYDPATGSLTDIHTLNDGRSLISASSINASGQVSGQVTTPAGTVYSVSANAFVRNADGTAIDFGNTIASTPPNTIGCYYAQSFVSAITDSGQVIMNSISSSGSAITCATAFIGNTNGNGLQPLGSLSGGGASTWDDTKAYGINSKGQVVGTSALVRAYFPQEYRHAFVSTATGLKDLNKTSGTPEMPLNIALGLPGAAYGTTSNAYAINDSGIAVGEYTVAMTPGVRGNGLGFPIMHPVAWNTVTDTYIDLASPNKYGSLSDINANGQVVGRETSVASAFIYSPATNAVVGNATGGLIDLNTLVSGLPSGWILTNAYKISNAGLILANAKDASAAIHSVLLTPTTSPMALPAASNLAALAAASTQINLTWTDNASNETAYTIERCQGAGCGSFTQITSLAANVTSYSDTALTPATSYSYRVRAHGAAGDSVYSNIATASTSAGVVNAAPAPPTSLISTAKTNSQVLVSWADNATDELNYLIERCKGSSCSNFAQIASVGANVTTYSNTGLRRSTTYNYRVKAANATSQSAYSNTLSIKTLP